MRRVTVRKPLKKTDVRRVREEADASPCERPEIRKDIARTWWPEADGPGGAAGRQGRGSRGSGRLR